MPQTILTAPLRTQRISKRALWIGALWLVATISLGAMAISCSAGKDVAPSWTAMQSVGHGGSPYSEGIAALKAYFGEASHKAGEHVPLVFWYPPLTIPVLRLLAMLPCWLLGTLYWSAIVAGFLLQLRTGFTMASEEERRWLVFLLPFVAFFPDLLSDESALCGNIAYILYGLVMAAALPGLKRNKWLWYYLAVIAASICKAPMLTLLAFPLLVGRRQWMPACITGAAGCSIFAIQPLLWPAQFKEFMLSVRLVFDWVHDFSFSPSGVLGRALWEMKKPYAHAVTIAYLVWAVVLGTVLLTISSYVRRHPNLREMWIPIAFMGTILLNPRIMEYDVAPLTVLMILVLWRGLLLAQQRVAQQRVIRAIDGDYLPAAPAQSPRQASFSPNLVPVLFAVGWFTVCNIFNIVLDSWVPVELAMLLSVFALGLWSMNYMAYLASFRAPLEGVVEWTYPSQLAAS